MNIPAQAIVCDWPGCKDTYRHYHLSQISNPASWSIDPMDDISLIAVFIFYKKATGVQARLAFSEEFKHCNIITYDGADWIMVDMDRTGLLTRKIKCKNVESLVRNLRVVQDITATITVAVDNRHQIAWKPFWVRSCNEICRYASGVDIGFTFNPIHLYWKLLKCRNGKNYELLSAWRRSHGILWRRQRATEPSGTIG